MVASRASAHVPQRRCVGCGRSSTKAELVRLVAGPQGVEIDPEGRRAGRGAYLCRNRDCADAAIRRRALSRSLRAPVSVADQTLDSIEAWPRSASTR
jgi:predicted RNA-binding protein YlxR (DUF448 family)